MSSPQMTTMLGLCCCCAATGVGPLKSVSVVSTAAQLRSRKVRGTMVFPHLRVGQGVRCLPKSLHPTTMHKIVQLRCRYVSRSSALNNAPVWLALLSTPRVSGSSAGAHRAATFCGGRHHLQYWRCCARHLGPRGRRTVTFSCARCQAGLVGRGHRANFRNTASCRTNDTRGKLAPPPFQTIDLSACKGRSGNLAASSPDQHWTSRSCTEYYRRIDRSRFSLARGHCASTTCQH